LAPYCHPPILALSIAVFVGGLLQLLLQLPYVKNIGMLVVPNFHFKDSAVWRVVRQMGPAIFGISVAQLSLVINTIFASFLVSGSISWIYYADRLMGLPVGLLAASLSTILLPLLSQHAVNRNQKHFSCLLDWAIRLSLVLSLPASVGLAILSMPIIQTLFMYDQFTYYDAQMTQQALIAYSIGIVGIMLVKVFAPSFYAMKDMKTPVKVAILSIVLTQLMNGLFIWHLRHAGLALSIALGATFNAIMLWIFLRKYQLYQPNPGWAVFLSQLALAVGMMAAVLVLLPVYLPCQWDGTLWQRAGWLMFLIGAGGITYFAVLYATGLRLHHLTHRIE
jgi:putative peptidoglycan lipid II flippase